MTTHSSGIDQLPIYDSLVREQGDVVAEVREVAEQMLFQAAQALRGHHVVQQRVTSPDA
ncbi:hypothetical protein [Streptomyces griseus]|uniref:hypothetical protein n=1 Tax=Streptomyces griseus TaxID=1911 RepID=UPI000AC82B62|nr:hypothetical protein [Streptomyces griseus]